MRLIISLIFLSGLVSGCAANQQVVSAAPFAAAKSNRARSLEAEGRLAEARYHWKLVAAVSPSDGSAASEVERLGKAINARKSATLKRGEAAWAKGKTNRARRYFLKVLALDGADAVARRRLVEIERRRALNNQDNKDEAVLLAYMAKQPNRRKVVTQSEFLLNAKTYLDRGDYVAVFDSSETFLETRPRSKIARKYKYLACVALADESRKSGRFTKAVFFLDTARGIRRSGIDAPSKQLDQTQALLARALDKEGRRLFNSDLDRTIELWTKALTYDPNLIRTQERLDKATKMRDRLKSIKKPAA